MNGILMSSTVRCLGSPPLGDLVPGACLLIGHVRVFTSFEVSLPLYLTPLLLTTGAYHSEILRVSRYVFLLFISKHDELQASR